MPKPLRRTDSPSDRGMRYCAFMIDSQVRQELVDLADERGWFLSDVLREAVAAYLAAEHSKV